MRRSWPWLCVLAWVLRAVPVQAGGFDTPILYTARHQGMGGTAIGYVEDPSAAFHNPAGLQGVAGFGFIADLSLVIGRNHASPDVAAAARSIDSEVAVAPFFLLGAAYRVHEWLSVGVATFPVGSGGATFRYADDAGVETEDETTILFLEVTPALSVNVPRDRLLPGRLAFGIGYRIDVLDFAHKKGPPGDPTTLDLELSGTSFTGLRAGVEYGFHEQNDVVPLQAEIAGEPFEIANVFAWRDAATLRAGAQYALGARRTLPIRIGYIFDDKVTNERFPSAFGTPPVATHSLTAGIGYVFDPFEINVAYAYRFGSTTVRAGDLAPAAECPFCSAAGEYELKLHGFFVDLGGDLPFD